ncbi:hypothetical protein SARC_17907, partial [Sphaeroforma arctica JP610]
MSTRGRAGSHSSGGLSRTGALIRAIRDLSKGSIHTDAHTASDAHSDAHTHADHDITPPPEIDQCSIASMAT